MERGTVTTAIPNRRVLAKRGKRKPKAKKVHDVESDEKNHEYSSSSSDSSDSESSSSSSEEQGSSTSGENSSDEEAEDQEEKKYYRPGGYHPVRIGEIYNNGRYKVIRKLGWGVFSTVWLCKDVPSGKYAALKIMRSNSRYTEAAEDEIKLLTRVQTADGKDERKLKTVQLLNYFTIRGPHGQHICMSLEICGPNLYTVITKRNEDGLPIAAVKSIMKQILEALDYLHTKCKMIHTDLKPENILTCLKPSAVQKLEKEAEDLIKSGEKLPSSLIIHAPTYYPTFVTEEELKNKKVSKNVKKKLKKKAKKIEERMLELPKEEAIDAPKNETDKDEINEIAEENPMDMEVKIGDLGCACFVDDQYTSHIQTRQYRSPEVILGHKYDTSTDIWSMACIGFELATGNYLFDPRRPKHYSRDEEHLCFMMRVLGEIPKKMRLEGSKSRKFFNIKTGKLKHAQEFEARNLYKTLTRKYKMDKEEAEGLAEFLLPMLEYEPQKRATAADCLKHKWLLVAPNTKLECAKEKMECNEELEVKVPEIVKQDCALGPGQGGSDAENPETKITSLN